MQEYRGPQASPEKESKLIRNTEVTMLPSSESSVWANRLAQGGTLLEGHPFFQVLSSAAPVLPDWEMIARRDV